MTEAEILKAAAHIMQGRRSYEKQPRTCRGCGAAFPGSPTARYCSTVCRQRAYRDRLQAKGPDS